MFQLASNQGKEYSEQAKVRELLSKCQNCSFLSSALGTLAFQQTMNSVTYQAAVNHLQLEISKQHPAGASFCSINQVFTNPHGRGQGKTAGQGRFGRGGPGKFGSGTFSPSRGRGNSSMGFIPAKDWEAMSPAEKNKVQEKHTQKGKKGGLKQDALQHKGASRNYSIPKSNYKNNWQSLGMSAKQNHIMLCGERHQR